MNTIKFVHGILKKHPIVTTVICWLLLSFIGAYAFYLRYPYAYNHANFYAEDGTVWLRNILNEGPIKAMATLFNGYLVVGQYMVAEFAMLINAMFGKGFETIPKAFAVASYLFWGVVCSLPYLLFKKRMGLILALLTVCLLLIVPLGGYDYVAIGTIGNLKFAFLFITALLVTYRNQNDLAKYNWQFALIDLTLLLCVLTNIISIALLPFALLRYKKEIKLLFIKWRSFLKSLTFQHYSLISLFVICTAYVVAVYIKGIPKIPGYLDGPLLPGSLIAIIYRGSIYGLLFPINILMNNIIAIVLIISVLTAAFFNKYRYILLFFIVAILINVFGFVFNRPGITHSFLTYDSDGGPGFFFYAGTMIFVFAVMYAIQDWFKIQTHFSKTILSAVVIGYAIIVVPMSGSRGASYEVILSKRPTMSVEVKRVCSTNTGNTVEMGIYPADIWTLTLKRSQVCSE